MLTNPSTNYTLIRVGTWNSSSWRRFALNLLGSLLSRCKMALKKIVKKTKEGTKKNSPFTLLELQTYKLMPSSFKSWVNDRCYRRKPTELKGERDIVICFILWACSILCNEQGKSLVKKTSCLLVINHVHTRVRIKVRRELAFSFGQAT